MRRKTVLSRLATLIVVMTTCFVVVVLAPLLLERRMAEESFSSSMVIASARDFYLVTMPIRLSDAPDLTLSRGAFYADNNVTTGAPISKIVLDGPVFTLNASGLRAGGIRHEHGADGVEPARLAPLMEAVTTLAFDGLTIRRGTLHVTTVDGKAETLSDIQAELTGRRKGQVTARGQFTARGQRLSFDVALSMPDKKSPLRWPVKASLKGDLLELSFDGQLDVGDDLQLVGQMDLSTSSLRRAARWFGVPLVQHADGLGSAAARGQFNWTRRTIAFEKANITVDGSEAVGTFALNHAGERPSIDATLAFGALDLTPYVEAARARPSVFDHQGTKGSFDLSFPIIKHVDADLRISAPKVAFKGFTLGRGAATITVNSGRLIADIAELDLPAATASAQVTANMNGAAPRYTLRGKLNCSDAAIAAASLLGAPVLAGRTMLAVDLASTGHTPAEFLARLSGKASLTMPEGGKLALDPKLLLQAAKTNDALGWAALTKTPASFDHVEARAIFQDGVAISDAVHARAGGIGLTASGHVNLAEGKLDLRLGVKPDVPSDRPMKPSDVAEADVVTIRGHWSGPVVQSAPLGSGDPR